MKLESLDLRDGQAIDPRFALGRQDPDTHMQLSDNLSPHLKWSDVPEGARSFAILCVDPDVPADAADVNQEGKSLPAGTERVDFFHWVMINLPADLRELQTGECSEGVTARGKQNPPGPRGARQGLNTYTQFMAGDPDMAGQYFGYDGPCPPWNDERLHHYVFTVFALDLPTLDVTDPFDGEAARAAMDGHVLDQAGLTGTYTLNPDVSG